MSDCQHCNLKDEHIKKLAKRIHNQRVALRDNWDTVEMRIREGCMAPKSPLRSKWWDFIKKRHWTMRSHYE